MINRCLAVGLLLSMAPVAVFCSLASPASAQLSINGKKVTPQQFHGAELANEGIVLLRQNRNAEAAEKLREAVMLNPNLPEAFHNLGLALAKLGDTAGAVQALNQARSMKDLDATWLTLGGLYQANGQVSDALALYRDFTVKFPNHPMVQSGKLESLIRGLEREKNGGAGAPSGTGSPSASATGDDYLAQATRSGIVRWPAQRMPIRIFIKDGSRVAGYQSDFNGILRQSFEDWSRASGGLVRFDTASSADQADIVCTWIADPQLLANKAEAGEAHIYGKRANAPTAAAAGTTNGATAAGTGNNAAGNSAAGNTTAGNTTAGNTADSATAAGSDINRGTILLLTQPLSPGLPVTRNSIRLLCLHEIGHVLGLTGHTIVPSDIMFYSAVSYKDEWRYLSPRDAKTITRLYSSQ